MTRHTTPARAARRRVAALRPASTRAATRAATRASTRARRGMTLIELMVALLLLNVALLALAGLGGTVSHQLRGGALQTRAALVVQSRLDSLASVLPCQGLAPAGGQRTGSATTFGVSERWVIRDGDDVLHVIDTVRFAGRTKPLVYRSLIPCRD